MLPIAGSIGFDFDLAWRFNRRILKLHLAAINLGAVQIAFNVQAVCLHDIRGRRLRQGGFLFYAGIFLIRIFRACNGNDGKIPLRHTEFRTVHIDRCTADVHFCITICIGSHHTVECYIVALHRRSTLALIDDLREGKDIQMRFVCTRCKLEVHILSYIHLAAEHMDLIADNFRILERQSVRRRG